MRRLTVLVALLVMSAALTAQSPASHAPRLFFLDVRGGRIVSANTDGSDVRTLLTGLRGAPDGIVVDADYIYWTTWGPQTPTTDTSSERSLTAAS